MDAANILKPALARGELRAIGATTLNEYQKFFEKDKALERRFQKVMIDEDLATLYGVETRALNQAVKRNLSRFPVDFMFQLTKEEFENLKSQSVISSWGGRRKLPYAFTEYGAVMLASVLNSPQAVEASIFVVRAFVKLREFLAGQNELSKRVDDLEEKISELEEQHDAKFHQVFEALRRLIRQENEPRNPVGFKQKQNTTD